MLFGPVAFFSGTMTARPLLSSPLIPFGCPMILNWKCDPLGAPLPVELFPAKAGDTTASNISIAKTRSLRFIRFPRRSGERNRQANCVGLSPRACFDDTGCVTDGESIALIQRSNPSKMGAADVRAEFGAVYTAESGSK